MLPFDWSAAPDLTSHERMRAVAFFAGLAARTGLDPVRPPTARDNGSPGLIFRRDAAQTNVLADSEGVFGRPITYGQEGWIVLCYGYGVPEIDGALLASDAVFLQGALTFEEHAMLLTALAGDRRGFMPLDLGLSCLWLRQPSLRRPRLGPRSLDKPWHDLVALAPSPPPDQGERAGSLSDLLDRARRVLQEGYDEAEAYLDLARFFGTDSLRR